MTELEKLIAERRKEEFLNVNQFRMSQPGGKNVKCEGNTWFCHAPAVKEMRNWFIDENMKLAEVCKVLVDALVLQRNSAERAGLLATRDTINKALARANEIAKGDR